MKKLFIILAMALCLVGCAKEEPETISTPSTYTFYFGYSSAQELQKRLSYDAQLTECFYFYEYDTENNKIDYKVWDNPVLKTEKVFTANENAAKVVVFYEVKGYGKDGSSISLSTYLKDVVNIVKEQNVAITFSSSTPLSDSSPI